MKFKFKTKIKKGAPTALVVGGFLVTGAGIVYACKNTIKMKEIVDTTKEEKEEIQSVMSNVNPQNEEYSNEDYKKDIRRLNLKLALDAIKTYAAPVSIIATGFGMIGFGYGIKCKRYTELSAAHAGLLAFIEGYRERVKEKIGEEEEYKLFHNIETEEITEEGKKKKTKQEVMRNPELFDFIFNDTTADGAHGDAEYNHNTKEWDGYDLYLIKRAEESANEILNTGKGYLFVNDLRKMLGLDEIIDGQSYGWVKDPDDKEKVHLDIYVTMKEDGNPTMGVAINPEYIIDKLKD